MSGLDLLDYAAFTSERALMWMVAPFIPEHQEDFIVPLVIRQTPLVMGWRGLVLPATVSDLQLAGHTSSFNSKFSIARTDNSSKVQGLYNGEKVDYTVLMDTTMTVQGRTGKGHAKYSADHSREDIHVHGTVTGVHTDYRIALKPDGAMIEGIDMGETVSVEIIGHGSGWQWKGEAAQGFITLTGSAEADALLIVGTLYDHPTRISVEPTDTGCHVHGFDTWGNVDFTITMNGTVGYKVHGRADHNILDYTVTTSGAPTLGVSKTVAVPSMFDPPTEKVSEAQMQANNREDS